MKEKRNHRPVSKNVADAFFIKVEYVLLFAIFWNGHNLSDRFHYLCIKNFLQILHAVK